jgi:hypothetical protein
MWIWDLETGEARQGPSVKDAVQLVDAYAAEPGAGWVGVVSRDGDRQVAGLLRNFAPSDVPAPVLTGDLVAWTYDGAAVVAATKDVGTCTTLSVETVNLQVSSARARLDRRVCGDVTAVALAGKSPYFGLTQEVGVEVNKIWYGRITTWVRDGALVALGQHGATLVVPECGAADPETAPCGGLAYADPPSPGYVFMEEGVGALTHERFLGWARDGRTGYVLGTYGGVRGIYAARRIHQPQPPRLVVASDAQEVYVAEAYGATYGNLFISQDGALLLINTDGEQVPLTLPEGVPSPAGPIAWVTAVQEP